MALIRALVFCMLASSTLACAQEGPLRIRGRTLYLPVYSHIWYGDVDGMGNPDRALVSVLVSIRNTDLNRSMRLTSARYYVAVGRRGEPAHR